MTITSDFYKAFKPENERHVKWLKQMFSVSENMKDPTKHIMLVGEINLNPMKIEIKHGEALEWPNIHFMLSMKYSKAVLNGEAFIPGYTKNEATSDTRA
jgi:exonuclease III